MGRRYGGQTWSFLFQLEAVTPNDENLMIKSKHSNIDVLHD